MDAWVQGPLGPTGNEGYLSGKRGAALELPIEVPQLVY